MEKSKSQYLNPYLAGVLLGLVLLMAIFIAGRGLGASGAFKDLATVSIKAVAPEHATSSTFWSSNLASNTHPLKSWLSMEVLGVLIGGLLSGLISGRMKFKVERGPRVKVGTRLGFALLGGALFGIGAQLGRGCTSGAALSGMAVMSTGGIVTMMFIFGTGYAIAYFFRKLWI
ncbi:MAG: YeeE/YedE thiosulfate transporter family protein [Bacteroidales bacterium]|nr:YeeE/YedE thiosulfate transporter family protein [Bacteroidales bacterium]